MANLIVIGFEDEHRAQEVRLALLKMQREYLVDLEDAVVAVKQKNGKIKLHQIHDLTATGALTGGLWGTLIGCLFLSPLLGAAVGAAAGGISGALTDIGIDDQFMKQVSANLEPGTSALFALIRRATPDKVLDELQGFGGKVLQTSLTHEEEAKLQTALNTAKEQPSA